MSHDHHNMMGHDGHDMHAHGASVETTTMHDHAAMSTGHDHGSMSNDSMMMMMQVFLKSFFNNVENGNLITFNFYRRCTFMQITRPLFYSKSGTFKQ